MSRVPHTPVIAGFLTRPETVHPVLGARGALGTRAAVVLSAGVGARGAGRRGVRKAPHAAGKNHIPRVVGGHSVGIIGPRLGLATPSSPMAGRAGDISSLSHKGALLSARLARAVARRLSGFSVVALGGEMDDDDGGKMVYHPATHPDSGAILYHVGVTTDRRIMTSARAASSRTPAVVVQKGRSSAGARGAATPPTGESAAADVVDDAVRRRAVMRGGAMIAQLVDGGDIGVVTGEGGRECGAIVKKRRGGRAGASDVVGARRGKGGEGGETTRRGGTGPGPGLGAEPTGWTPRGRGGGKVRRRGRGGGSGTRG